jgi:hypothetical protein
MKTFELTMAEYAHYNPDCKVRKITRHKVVAPERRGFIAESKNPLTDHEAWLCQVYAIGETSEFVEGKFHMDRTIHEKGHAYQKAGASGVPSIILRHGLYTETLTGGVGEDALGAGLRYPEKRYEWDVTFVITDWEQSKDEVVYCPECYK